MKLTATDFNGKDVRLAIEPETEAERYQLRALRGKLFDEGAHCLDWDDMEGGRGICVVVEKMPLTILGDE